MARPHKKLVLKDTQIYGKGIFAAEDICKGEIIHVLCGEVMSLNTFVKKVNAGAENLDDALQIGCRTYLDMDEFSRTYNHSCDPNAGLRGQSELFALKNIKAGQEITFDYSTTIAPTVWKMKCRCGARKCRKSIGSIMTIPRKQLEEYKRLGALQDYMRRLLKRVGNGPYTLPKYEKMALKKLRIKHETSAL